MNKNIKYTDKHKIIKQINKIFDSINIEKNERNVKCDVNSLINYEDKNNNEKKINLNRQKKASVTIKNTVINLNIDTGYIIQPFDKMEKIKQINPSKVSNYLISEISENNRYIHINKNKNYINKEKINSNNIYQDKNKRQYKTSNINNNLLNINVENNEDKIISKKFVTYRDDKNIKMDEINDLNKSLNNNINKHIKFKSMKLK